MACKCAPALVALRNELNEAFPARDRTSDGCCGDAAHAARKSDHNPTGGYAHALDIDENIEPGRDLAWLWDAWRMWPDPRIKYLIYEGQIVYPNSTVDRRPRAYTGPNAHRLHLHISIVSTATHDTSAWLTRLHPPSPPAPPTDTNPPPPEEDTEMRFPVDVEAGPPGPGGLVPLWRLTGPDGGVQALNGATFYGSLPSIGETRTDAVGMVPRKDRDGYTITCEQIFQDPADGQWKTPTYSFPQA
jgi:hypothetical protein